MVEAEAASREHYHGRPGHSVPACQASPAGLRLLTTIDLPIGTRLTNVRREPMTLIGAGEQHAFVRYDDGRIEAVELDEISHSFTSEDDAFNYRLPIPAIDTLARLGHLLGELQAIDTADPDDGIDEQTIADAKAMRERLGRRLAEVCGETFTAPIAG